ncbi:hypothetical protein MUCCIDRAFT_106037 [Mucor lusitanicus CBS 277.49]|uniref:Uncharacterized protein n=1 Tax=Mucor lusitanicus CBS 277.49 TaxID=747725 RepID=A0A168QCT0_MUCCL|nr:hypothetical protein MUCCIDRAFT_106037 [Mucor lusitanicus CBS 277.49]
MPSAARNLWLLRLDHDLVSCEANLLLKILQLPDDLCVYCDQRETTAHMLSTYLTNNLEIWSNNYFSLVFLPFGAVDMSGVYQKAMSLNLSSLHLLNSPLKISVFEAVTCVLTAIWLIKWRAYSDNVGIDDNQFVMDLAMSNLRKTSSLNLFS